MFLQGPDKHGRGVIILKTSRHSKTKRDLEETKRCICYTLDHQIRLHDLRLNPDAKGLGIFDLRGTHPFPDVPIEPFQVKASILCFRNKEIQARLC